MEGTYEVACKLLRCSSCGTSTTPMWRVGPSGPRSLCNACGIKWQRRGKTTSTSNKRSISGVERASTDSVSTHTNSTRLKRTKQQSIDSPREFIAAQQLMEYRASIEKLRECMNVFKKQLINEKNDEELQIASILLELSRPRHNNCTAP